MDKPKVQRVLTEINRAISLLIVDYLSNEGRDERITENLVVQLVELSEVLGGAQSVPNRLQAIVEIVMRVASTNEPMSPGDSKLFYDTQNNLAKDLYALGVPNAYSLVGAWARSLQSEIKATVLRYNAAERLAREIYNALNAAPKPVRAQTGSRLQQLLSADDADEPVASAAQLSSRLAALTVEDDDVPPPLVENEQPVKSLADELGDTFACDAPAATAATEPVAEPEDECAPVSEDETDDWSFSLPAAATAAAAAASSPLVRAKTAGAAASTATTATTLISFDEDDEYESSEETY